MLDEMALFTPEQGRLLWQWYLSSKKQNPHIQHNYFTAPTTYEVSPHRVFVLNTEAEVIPPYACMRITGVDVVGGQTVVKVEKPSSVEGEFLFNCQFEIPVASGSSAGVGWAYRYGIVIMKGNGTAPTAANVEYRPVVDSWAIEEGGGPFVVFGESNVLTDAVIGRFVGGGGGVFDIEFTVISMDCYSDPWILTVEPTWFTGGCTATIPGADPYTGYVEVENRCNIADHFTAENIVGLTGTATYRYPRTDSYCTPAWRLDDICGEGECPL